MDSRIRHCSHDVGIRRRLFCQQISEPLSVDRNAGVAENVAVGPCEVNVLKDAGGLWWKLAEGAGALGHAVCGEANDFSALNIAHVFRLQDIEGAGFGS